MREHAPVIAKPSAVVFDNDGLLLDTEEAWTRAERTLFERRGSEFTREHKQNMIGSSRVAAAVKLEEMLERPGEGEVMMDELLELVMVEALEPVSPRPGALQLIARLKQAGLPLALASNSEPEFVERVLRGAGLLDGGPFAAIVTAADVERPKPAPDIYLEACRRLGVPPQQAAALEDSPVGVAAAAAAGMFVIGIPFLPGAPLPGSDLIAERLDAPEVASALGLDARAGGS